MFIRGFQLLRAVHRPPSCRFPYLHHSLQCINGLRAFSHHSDAEIESEWFEPLLQHISYVFGPHDIFGLLILSGDTLEWYDRLKNDALVGSYRGVLDIPFVMWPIFNNEIEDDIPLNIDLAR